VRGLAHPPHGSTVVVPRMRRHSNVRAVSLVEKAHSGSRELPWAPGRSSIVGVTGTARSSV
jgi:hypothetical protein